jgi:hypothetical protein
MRECVVVFILGVILLVSAQDGYPTYPYDEYPTNPYDGYPYDDYDTYIDPQLVQPSGVQTGNMVFGINYHIYGTIPYPIDIQILIAQYLNIPPPLVLIISQTSFQVSLTVCGSENIGRMLNDIATGNEFFIATPLQGADIEVLIWGVPCNDFEQLSTYPSDSNPEDDDIIYYTPGGEVIVDPNAATSLSASFTVVITLLIMLFL